MDEQLGPESDVSLTHALGSEDPALGQVIDRMALRSLLARLPERERRILSLYFGGSLTRREVADVVGVSQMRVSRLLSRACAFLRYSQLLVNPSGVTFSFEPSAAAGNVCPLRSGVRCVLSACRPEALVLDVLG
ncbi:sigma-70 family RNA polymerase sigma factor, partial [Streptomyces sp. NPDC006265]|uniref:sigma-70 family RNA polymerase sigma factor n=1 Tax=Streptomyces sp. NPDC006265 TaxID=3156740 RepID=UPI0033B14F0B